MADEYNPDPNATVPNPGLISKTRQDLSAGLLEASFGILGETFASEAGNPALAVPYAKLGNTISNALHDRWHKQEYENFQAQYVNSYQQAAQSIQGNLQMQMGALDRGELMQPDGSITKIDVKSEGFLRTKDTVIRQSMQAVHKINDQFLQDAAKYSTNPYISNVAQSLMQSNSAMISEATGPTPGAETEKGYSEMATDKSQRALMKSQAGYYDRMPSDGGSGSEKENQRGDPRKLLGELGPDGFLEHLVGTPMGLEWTAPYQRHAEALIRDQIIESDPMLADDPDQLAARMAGQEAKVQEVAAGLYMKTVFPEYGNQMADMEAYDRFFLKPKEPVATTTVTGRLTNEETDTHIEKLQQDSLTELEDIVRNRNPRTIDQAVDMLVNKWLPKYLKKNVADNRSTAEFKKEAKKRLIKFLANPDNLAQLDIVAQKYNLKKRGIFSRIATGVESAVEESRKGLGPLPETQAGSPEEAAGLYKRK